MKHFIKSLFENLGYSLFRRKKILLVFVGDMVFEVINEQQKQWRKKCNIMYVSTDKNSMHLCSNSKSIHKIYIGDNEPYSCGKRRYEDGFHYAQSNAKLWHKYLKRFQPELIIVVNKMGYNSGCGITAYLHNLFTEVQVNTFSFVFKPLTFEGTEATQNFEKALLFMKKYPYKIWVDDCTGFFQNESLTDYLARSIIPYINSIISK